jgi:hypothetical protein
MRTRSFGGSLSRLSRVAVRFKQRTTALAHQLLDGQVEYLLVLRASVDGASLTPADTDRLLDRAEEAWRGVCSEVRVLADPERDSITVFAYGPSTAAMCGRLPKLMDRCPKFQQSTCQCQKGRCGHGGGGRSQWP